MSPFALILITISAFAHAFWNLLGKRQNPSTAFFFIASSFAAICFSPLLIIFRQALPLIPWRVWIWLMLTSLFEVIYYIGLAGAYRHGDMSVAYPLARSIPVITVALITSALKLGRPLSLLGVAGILAVAIGCLLLPQRSFGKLQAKDYLTTCCLLAGVAGIGTTGYTLVDNQALFELRSASNLGLSQVEIAFFYLALESIIIAIVMGGVVMITAAERNELAGVWKKGKGVTLITGILIIGTYGLVLTAMAYASNVSYIAAFRQLSIPLGAIFGIVVQKERAYPPKLASIGIIFAGLVLITLV